MRAGLTRGDLLAQGADEIANRRSRARLSLESRERETRLGGGDLLALIGLDAAQDIGHGARFDAAMSLRSVCSTAPSSSTCAASFAPSVRFFALPAMQSAAAAFSMPMSR